ncbi:hypothetical protein OG618_37295 (plasmid) [Kitasatospora sp. NBC_01246]|uniref:hypothetical protein n=1 Tax=Kitasatospora sp. NBC_01246 TaxID=2903570 RepID=UPI002E3425F0|nr:hypothetical protein [Kitasatospora sp. NBC_01246]
MDGISPAAQALYMSMHETGALVTPSEVVAERAARVAELGFNGLRVESLKRRLFAASAEPEAHRARMVWAAAAEWFADPEWEAP